MKTTSIHNIVRLRPLNDIMVEKHRLPDNTQVDDWTKISWSVDHVASLVDLVNYRYFWFELIQLTRTLDKGVITFRSDIVRNSGKYFINSFVETYEDVCVSNKSLAQQMTNLGWTHVVRNVAVDNYWTEHFDPDKDRLIEA